MLIFILVVSVHDKTSKKHVKSGFSGTDILVCIFHLNPALILTDKNVCATVESVLSCTKPCCSTNCSTNCNTKFIELTASHISVFSRRGEYPQWLIKSRVYREYAGQREGDFARVPPIARYIETVHARLFLLLFHKLLLSLELY